MRVINLSAVFFLFVALLAFVQQVKEPRSMERTPASVSETRDPCAP